MKILQINSVYGQGSTGIITQNLHNIIQQQNWECKTAYRYVEKDKVFDDTIIVSSWFDCHVHNRISTLTNLQGCFSMFHTLFFLKKVDTFHPDIIHLHNIHGSYINHSLLFRYIKKRNVHVIWTLHDCWAFTGQCPYFTMVKCDKWKTGCHDCSSIHQYTASMVDRTKTMWKWKRKWFTGVYNMTLVTPSQWLADLMKQSYLKDYPVEVINNGIDLSIFKPTPSHFREKYGIAEEKYIVLGVAFDWGKRKGLDVFIELARRLDEKYQIVLVGTDDTTDEQLPDNILSIHRTHDQKELAEIYNDADLFANPTREENFPTVNIESLACGTPVLTFRTGGSPEILNETCGSVVNCDDVDAMEREILRICETKPYSEEACLKRASMFDMKDKFSEYITLYKRIAENDI